MDEATATFLAAVDELPEAAWEQPTALPGWRAREIVAHVHLNAEALRNLVTWATTGVETPMYASSSQRDADIERTAGLSPTELRELVGRSAEALARDLDAMSGEAWERSVVTAQGRTVPASEILWMRSREVAVHAIDLPAGAQFEDLPDELVVALVHDVVALRLRRGEAPTLAAWLTGRGTSGEQLGPWI